MEDLTVVYYTSNFLDTENPYFLANTKKQLVQAIGKLPLLVISQKPVERFPGYNFDYRNVVVGDIGRSHLNIYKQIMLGASEAKTKYVAMAEDDILYSYDHFHTPLIDREYKTGEDFFLYDMCKVSLFTWNTIPMFSFRSKRRVVNQLIAPARYLATYLTRRFNRTEEMLKAGRSLESILHIFGDPGRYDDLFGIIPASASREYYCSDPSIVFSHPKAFGYLSRGRNKRLGDIRIIELYSWGRADKLLSDTWGIAPRI